MASPSSSLLIPSSSTYLPIIYLPNYLSIYPSIHPFTHLPMHVSTYLLSIYIPVYPYHLGMWCCNTYHRLSRLEQIYFFTVLDTRCMKSRFQQGWSPLKAMKENLTCLSPSFWWLADNHWDLYLWMQHSALLFHLHMTFSLYVSVSVSKFFLFIDTLV